MNLGTTLAADRLAALEAENRLLREAIEWLAHRSSDGKARQFAAEALAKVAPTNPTNPEIDGEWCI